MDKYKCPECGWIGTIEEMKADFIHFDDGEEMWSNWICPSCEYWNQPEDYEKIS